MLVAMRGSDKCKSCRFACAPEFGALEFGALELGALDIDAARQQYA